MLAPSHRAQALSEEICKRHVAPTYEARGGRAALNEHLCPMRRHKRLKYMQAVRWLQAACGSRITPAPYQKAQASEEMACGSNIRGLVHALNVGRRPYVSAATNLVCVAP